AASAERGSVNSKLERRSAELKQLDDYQHSVLSSLQHAVLVLDRSGTVTTWNQTAERVWGLRAEHVLNRPLWSLPIGDMAHKIREAVTRVVDSAAPELLREVPFILPTGEPRQMNLQVTPLKNHAGDITGVVAVAPMGDSRR